MTNAQLLAVTVSMPSLGENVTEGTVTRWLKQPGEHVDADEPLLEVATDKVDTEIPSPRTGTLREIFADEDTTVAIGDALASVETLSEPTDTPAPQAAPPRKQPVSPPKRHADGIIEKLPRIRQTIARRMVESLHTSAQLTTVVEVDVTNIARLRARHKDDFLRRTGIKLSYLPFFAKAAVEALGAHRMLNASLNADCTEVTYHQGCHLGMAVDSDKGLMVPVIRDAQDLGISGLARAISDVADRVRTGKVTADELGGGTFTLTNTGSRGALFDTPIINQPQTGILGTGAVVDRVVPLRDPDSTWRISVRSMAYLSISYDHRIVDGADAARFLGAIKHRLETGFSLNDLP
ncbi:MAG: 2-oxo acid dehydrogenase subunit E2 [Actinomycetota bacterium]|nr:2-oxo acid dehydrogenase subunit E2 [Actinomycetota bacterium]